MIDSVSASLNENKAFMNSFYLCSMIVCFQCDMLYVHTVCIHTGEDSSYQELMSVSLLLLQGVVLLVLVVLCHCRTSKKHHSGELAGCCNADSVYVDQ